MTSKPPAKKGPPSTYTEAKAEAICARIAEGEPLRQICRDEGMPAWTTVYNWMNENPTFAERIARARVLGFDAIAEECLEIADDSRHDTKWVGSGENAHEAADTEWISRSKLRVETRLKLLAKWDPKRYGERTQTELSGNVGITKGVSDLTDEELLAIARGRAPRADA